MSVQARDLAVEFAYRFGRVPTVSRAPGRVNLIGEHTDYNDCFVMPAALEFATLTAASPRPDRRLRVYSLIMDETLETLGKTVADALGPSLTGYAVAFHELTVTAKAADIVAARALDPLAG